jgi:hypothetical protein
MNAFTRARGRFCCVEWVKVFEGHDGIYMSGRRPLIKGYFAVTR